MVNIWENPWFQAGVGTLAAAAPGVHPSQAIGTGLMTGIRQQRLTEEARRRNAEIERRNAYTDFLMEQAREKQAQQRSALQAQQAYFGSRLGQLEGVEGPLTPQQQYERDLLTGAQTAYGQQAIPASDFMTLLQMPAQREMQRRQQAREAAQAQAEMQQERDIEMAKLMNAQQLKQMELGKPVSIDRRLVHPSTGQVVYEPEGGGVFTPKERFDMQSTMQKQFEPYQAIASVTGEIYELLKDPSGFANQAVITKIAKLLDPTTGVLQGETAAWASAGGLADKLRGLLSQAAGKGFLQPGQKQAIIRMTRTLADEARKTYERRRGERQQVLPPTEQFLIPEVSFPELGDLSAGGANVPGSGRAPDPSKLPGGAGAFEEVGTSDEVADTIFDRMMGS